MIQSAGATMTSVLHVDMTDPSPLAAGKIQDSLSQSRTNAHVPREHDGLSTAFEVAEQETVRKLNGGLEEVNRSSSAGRIPRPHEGSA